MSLIKVFGKQNGVAIVLPNGRTFLGDPDGDFIAEQGGITTMVNIKRTIDNFVISKDLDYQNYIDQSGTQIASDGPSTVAALNVIFDRTTKIQENDNVTFQNIVEGQVLKIVNVGGNTLHVQNVEDIDELSTDTTPQLGGDLDVNGNKITSASNGDITLDPDGTGAIVFKSDDIQFDGGGAFSGKIKLYESDLAGSNFISIQAPLLVTSDTTLTLPDGAGSTGEALKTDGNGVLSWGKVSNGVNDTFEGITSFKKVGAAEATIALYDGDESNFVSLKAPQTLTASASFILPGADGTSGQAMVTDGSGNLSFTTISGGTDTNLGNTDMTLSASRTVEMGSNHLDFQSGSTSKFKIFSTGTAVATSRFTVNGNGVSGGQLRMKDADDSNILTLKPPDSMSSNTTFVLPGEDGTDGQVLKTDGSGNLSFASAGASTTLTQVYSQSFFDDISTIPHYLPFKDINEQGQLYQEEAAMLMPFSGRIKSISLKSTSLTGNGDLTLRVNTIGTGSSVFNGAGWTIEESEVLPVTSTDDNHTFHFVFDNAQHFEAGDLCTASIQASADISGNGYWHVTTIVEFDTSNNLGTTSTEHETNP